MNAHNEQSSVVEKVAAEMREFYDAEMAPDDDVLKSWIDRLAAQPSPVVKQNLTTQPAAAQEAVAYLDIGAGGYLDIGSDLPEEQLLALPNGRHALGIIGTYGIDGYVSAPVTAAPTLDDELAQDRMSELSKLERDVLDALPGVYYMDPPDGGDVSLGEQVKRMAEDAANWRKHASTPAAPGIDLYPIRCALQYAAAAARENTHTEMAEGFDALIRKIDASPKGGSDGRLTFEEWVDGEYGLGVLSEGELDIAFAAWNAAMQATSAHARGVKDGN